MTSVPQTDIGYDFSTDPLAAQFKVNGAQLQAVLVDLYTQKNALLAALETSIRDDDTLTDALVRSRNLHAEVTLAIAAAMGWNLKQACVAATTVNVTLSNPGVSAFDGRTVTAGDRILVWAQTDAKQNGIYVFDTSSTAMVRATDCDSTSEIDLAATPVNYGTLYRQSFWVMNTEDAVLGTDDLTWVHFGLADTAVISPGTMRIQSFLAGTDFTPGTTDELTLDENPGSVLNTLIHFDGVCQQIDGYSLTDATITFTSPIPIGVNLVEVRSASTVAMEAIYPDTIYTDAIQDEAVTLAKLDDAVVDRLRPLDPQEVGTTELEDGSVTPAKLSAASLLLFAASVPIGACLPYGGASSPSSSWLICNGASLLRADYPDLFTAIGTVYGAADGTHFNVPDLRGRSPIGAGTGSGLTARAAGTNYGAETHTLTKGETPAHVHAYHGDAAGPGSGLGIAFTTGTTGNTDDGQAGGLGTGGSGAASAHSILQPVLGMNFIIRAL